MNNAFGDTEEEKESDESQAKDRKNEEIDCTQKANSVREDEATLGGPKFSPPLYRQRYMFCANLLAKHGIKRVVDMGCAECQIMMYLKQVACLERIGLVDRDAVSLELNKFKIQPLITDHLDPRETPLTVEMYRGNLTDHDPRMAEYEAVTMVELIEHLPEAELKAFPMTIFGKMHPKLVIITTPNADFNQLFPDLTGFRHWDHKFEWTMQEFQDWCREQAVQFEYDIDFTGLGAGPPGTEPLGYCSQAAIFTSKSSSPSQSSSSSSPSQGEFKYTLVSSAVHPHRKETFSREEKITMEVNYCLNHLSKNPDYCDGLEHAVIPVVNLHDYVTVKVFFSTVEDLRDFLVTHGYPLTPDSASVLFYLEQKEFGEGLEWGCGYETAELSDSGGQFSDAEDDPTPWQPPEAEDLWD